jgi:hypothetical protein
MSRSGRSDGDGDGGGGGGVVGMVSSGIACLAAANIISGACYSFSTFYS